MTLWRHLLVGLVIAVPLASSQAQVAGLSDMVGARAGQAELEVQRRGYVFVRTEEGTDAKQSFWRRGGECVRITTRDGRYQDIAPANSRECEASSSRSNTAAVAAGVAIVGLAAALAAHKRHHADADREHDTEYERGYQAALFGADYDDRHETEGYHEGFLAGEAERGNRRAANTRWVRNAPPAAQSACSRRADEFMNRPYGSSVPVGVRDLGRGEYELTMATGKYRSRCTVDAGGQVRAMNPY